MQWNIIQHAGVSILVHWSPLKCDSRSVLSMAFGHFGDSNNPLPRYKCLAHSSRPSFQKLCFKYHPNEHFPTQPIRASEVETQTWRKLTRSRDISWTEHSQSEVIFNLTIWLCCPPQSHRWHSAAQWDRLTFFIQCIQDDNHKQLQRQLNVNNFNCSWM